MSGANTGNAKALVGVIFLQWVVYAIFYLVDELVGIAPTHYSPLIGKKKNENNDQQQQARSG